MTRPPTLCEARTRKGLLAPHHSAGIVTFSNGSEWELWADHNCLECWHYDSDAAGASCAFEGASLLGIVTPDLARLFGWMESAEFPGCFSEPDRCPFFRSRKRDDGEDNPPPPDPDPNQLVLLADPTEDAAALAKREARRERDRLTPTDHPLRSRTSLARDARWTGERTRAYWLAKAKAFRP